MPDGSDAAFAEITDKARAHAFDWYLAALRAPAAARADLLVLAAFRGEISRIPLEITDATLAEIKLQWWRDALEQGAFGARSGNPVTDALLDLLERRALPHRTALLFIDGIARELYEDGFEDEAALPSYARETEGAMADLALGCLDARPGDAETAFREAAETALALTRLAQTLPLHIARGRLPVPPEWRREDGDPRGADGALASERASRLQKRLVARAREALLRAKLSQSSVSKTNFAAFLTIVLVEPSLRSLERTGHDALRDLSDISPLTRVVQLLAGSVRGRI